MNLTEAGVAVLVVLMGLGGASACAKSTASREADLSRAGAPDSQVGAKPVGGKVEIIPNRLYGVVSPGDLETTVDGTISCWHYVSDGLRSVGQKEIWVTIKRAPGEVTPPPDPFLLYNVMFKGAENGSHADIGYVASFSEAHPGFLGRKDLRGVVYVPLEPSAQRALPFPTIGAVFVTAAEAKAAIDFGVLRIMGTLGRQHRCFPTAMWNDRTRPELPFTTSTPPNSLLSMLPSRGAPGIFVELRSQGLTDKHLTPAPRVPGDKAFAGFENAAINVSVPRTAQAPLHEALSSLDGSMRFALIGDPDPTAVASFAWSPDQSQAEVIGFRGHDGRRISGVFAAFSPDPTNGTSTKLAEDGFVILLNPKDWESLRSAIINGRDVTIPTSGLASSVQVLWR